MKFLRDGTQNHPFGLVETSGMHMHPHPHAQNPQDRHTQNRAALPGLSCVRHPHGVVGDTRETQRRARIREAVRDAMRAEAPPVTITALADRSGIAVNTVSGFLAGKSWPQPAKLAALAQALGFPPGHLDRVARGETVDANLTRSGESDDHVRFGSHGGDDLVVGLTPGALRDRSAAERERILAAAKLAALRELDAIDRSRGREEQGDDG